MGNIYFEQQKYPAAIKMYRMALDQVPLTSASVRSKILRNIGVAFMRVGQYQVRCLLDLRHRFIKVQMQLLLCMALCKQQAL